MSENAHKTTQWARCVAMACGPPQAATGLLLALTIAVAQGGHHSLSPSSLAPFHLPFHLPFSFHGGSIWIVFDSTSKVGAGRDGSALADSMKSKGDRIGGAGDVEIEENRSSVRQRSKELI